MFLPKYTTAVSTVAKESQQHIKNKYTRVKKLFFSLFSSSRSSGGMAVVASVAATLIRPSQAIFIVITCV